VGAGVASGYGDINADLSVRSGLAPAGLAHLSPEVGYFIRPRLLLSISMRWEFVTGTNDLRLPANEPVFGDPCGADHICEGARTAFAGLARATIFGGEATRTIRPYVAFAVGGGAIRHTVDFPSRKLCGPTGAETCVDTVTAGPLFGWLGTGLRVRLASAFDLVGGVEVLVGGPNFTVNADVNVGAAVSF
jgi:hypothetical protein